MKAVEARASRGRCKLENNYFNKNIGHRDMNEPDYQKSALGSRCLSRYKLSAETAQLELETMSHLRCNLVHWLDDTRMRNCLITVHTRLTTGILFARG